MEGVLRFPVGEEQLSGGCVAKVWGTHVKGGSEEGCLSGHPYNGHPSSGRAGFLWFTPTGRRWEKGSSERGGPIKKKTPDLE